VLSITLLHVVRVSSQSTRNISVYIGNNFSFATVDWEVEQQGRIHIGNNFSFATIITFLLQPFLSEASYVNVIKEENMCLFSCGRFSFLVHQKQ
jgi:hypothetical protein